MDLGNILMMTLLTGILAAMGFALIRSFTLAERLHQRIKMMGLLMSRDGMVTWSIADQIRYRKAYWAASRRDDECKRLLISHMKWFALAAGIPIAGFLIILAIAVIANSGQ